jgi:hypothetical protein
MFIGHLLRKKQISGYIKNDLLEPMSIKKRHDELVIEMESRGMIHKTPIDFFDEEIIEYLTESQRNHKIDKDNSLMKLLARCDECERRLNWMKDIDANLI